jgi:hypothetical protein
MGLIACNGNSATPTTGYGAQYDVTEHGVTRRALEPSDGQFEEPVAASPDWMEIRIGRDRQAIYLPKTDTSPDLSYYHFGRSGVQYPNRPTQVDLEVSGLEWHTGDGLQLVSPNVGLSIHDLEIHFQYPSEGSTSVSQQAINWLDAQAPLLDSAQGDRIWVAQMTHRPLAGGGGFHHVLTRAGLAGDLTMVDGRASTLRAALAPIKLDRTVELRWQGTAYAALVAQAGPYAKKAASPAISVRTLPQALVENNNFYNRYFMYLPSVVDFGPLNANTDVAHTVAYGNPFSTRTTPWSDFVSVAYAMPVVIPTGGVTYAMVVQAIPVDALAGGQAVAPTISPVRNVKINGESTGVEHAGVGATPTISWDAPELGTASTYAVTIQAIVPVGTGKTVMTAGTFYTTSTSVTLPAKAMRDVREYVVNVAAISAKDHNLAARPLLGTVPYASAEYVTAKIMQ